MAPQRHLSKKNLKILAWKRGYHGVTGLAKALKRSRVTLHRAVKNPDQFGPTYSLLLKALHENNNTTT